MLKKCQNDAKEQQSLLADLERKQTFIKGQMTQVKVFGTNPFKK